MEEAYYKFKTDQSKMEEIKDYYNAPLIEIEKRPYDVFYKKLNNNVSINCYKSGNQYTIVFHGEKDLAKAEASIFFDEVIQVKKTKSAKNGEWEDLSTQIGSDEVGVGDFFLGFYICATYIDNKDIEYLESLDVKDSKQLTDSKIEEIGPLLIKKIKKHVLNITPNKLYEYKQKKLSTHMILAKAHNFCQQQLIDKYHINRDVPIYVDQFEREDLYLKYSKPQFENHIILQVKGESYYPSIACASCIARYCFLQDWNKMNEHFHMEIPKGASSYVDKVYKQLLKTYPKDDVDNYVKKFFKNYNKD